MIEEHTRQKIVELIEGELVDRPVPRSRQLLEKVVGKRKGLRSVRDMLFWDLTTSLRLVTRGVEAYRAGRRRRRVKREGRRARRMLTRIEKIHAERRQSSGHYRDSSAGASLQSAPRELTFLFFEARQVALIRYRLAAPRSLDPDRTYFGVCVAAVSNDQVVRLAHLWNLERTEAMDETAGTLQTTLRRCFPSEYSAHDWSWTRGAPNTLTVIPSPP